MTTQPVATHAWCACLGVVHMLARLIKEAKPLALSWRASRRPAHRELTAAAGHAHSGACRWPACPCAPTPLRHGCSIDDTSRPHDHQRVPGPWLLPGCAFRRTWVGRRSQRRGGWSTATALQFPALDATLLHRCAIANQACSRPPEGHQGLVGGGSFAPLGARRPPRLPVLQLHLVDSACGGLQGRRSPRSAAGRRATAS